jgi:cysteine rich repeat protein
VEVYFTKEKEEVSMKAKHIIYFCVALALLAFNVTAHALQECQADQEKFCKDAQKGHGEVIHCLRQNQDLLTPSCQQFLIQLKDRRNDRHAACRPDKEKFCKDIQPGEERIHQCLKKHESQLDPECRAKLQRGEQFEKVRLTCKTEKEKFCGGVEPGQGRIRACMEANESKFSKACRNSLEEMKKLKPTKKTA